jgi:hypothetical protein
MYSALGLLLLKCYATQTFMEMNPHQGPSIGLHTSPVRSVNYTWQKTNSVCNEKSDIFSIRMGLAFSLDDSSGSRKDAECLITYKNRIGYTLHG